MLSADEYEARELMRSRFLRLTTELMRGAVARTSFTPWEIELLLDVSACQIPAKRRETTLRQYQKAVERQLNHGPGPPMKLSEYLQMATTRRP